MPIFHTPIPPVFVGGVQPYAQRNKLTPVSLDFPPFVHRSRTAAFIALASWASYPPNVPNPGNYTFDGGLQPVAPRWLAPSITDVPVNNPPFSRPERTPAQISIAAWAAYPPNIPDPWAYTFMGQRQPLMSQRFIFGAQVDEPPYRHPSRTPAQIAIAWASYPPNVPDPASYVFMGGWQPGATRRAPLLADNPPFGGRAAAQQAAIIYAAWAETRMPIASLPTITGQIPARFVRVYGYVIQ